MTPSQCRMARAALIWSTQTLAEKAEVGVNTINRFEGGQDARISSVEKIRRALETAGCIFIAENGDGPGVRLRKASPGTFGIETKIEALEEKIATIPDADEPSPEAAMNVMRKAVAENELADLKGRQGRRKRK